MEKILDLIRQDLEFVENTHQYSLKGMILPSVSEVIKPLSQKVYGDISSSVLEQAAERGTNVHFYIEQYLKADWKPTLNEETEGYFNAFLEALKEPIFKNYKGNFESELRIYSPSLLYAGTLDMMIFDDTGKNATIIDFKTTVAEHPKLWSVQLTGYKRMVEEAGIKVKDMYVLKIGKDGKYKIIPLKDETGLFMACYMISKF